MTTTDDAKNVIYTTAMLFLQQKICEGYKKSTHQTINKKC